MVCAWHVQWSMGYIDQSHIFMPLSYPLLQLCMPPISSNLSWCYLLQYKSIFFLNDTLKKEVTREYHIKACSFMMKIQILPQVRYKRCIMCKNYIYKSCFKYQIYLFFKFEIIKTPLIMRYILSRFGCLHLIFIRHYVLIFELYSFWSTIEKSNVWQEFWLVLMYSDFLMHDMIIGIVMRRYGLWKKYLKMIRQYTTSLFILIIF